MKIEPNLLRTDIKDIDLKLVIRIIKMAKTKRNFVITPINILRITGFPTSNQEIILNNRKKIKKIKQILAELSDLGMISERKSMQDHLGIKEKAYDYNS